MKKYEQGEELLVKVLSPSRHHKDIIGPVHGLMLWTTPCHHEHVCSPRCAPQ